MFIKPVKLTTIFMYLFFISCDISNTDESDSKIEWECGTHNENSLFTGPKGGCYYNNSKGNKTYVDRSECSC